MLSTALASIKKSDKWQVAVIAFAVAYGIIISINLSANPVLWDEATHFLGGLLLSRGQLGMWAFTNALYPPLYDIFAAAYFLTLGPSVFAVRMVSVTFSTLTVLLVYKISNDFYASKRTGLFAALLLGVMPGIIWLSRVALIETLLIFTLSLSLYFFYRWMKTGKEKDRIICIITFIVGATAKYQVLIVEPIIVLLGLILWNRAYLKKELIKKIVFPKLLAIIVTLAVLATVLLTLYFSGVFDILFYAIRIGTEQKAVESIRYTAPVFYLIEMTWFGNALHPISIMTYILGFAGLGIMAFRRNSADKFLLLWFITVYLIFTSIPNKDWRYVTILFPVLAISASSFIWSTYEKMLKTSKVVKTRIKKSAFRFASVFILAIAIGAALLSCFDSYNWIKQNEIQVPIEQASLYVYQRMELNQTAAVACPLNRFNKFMVQFYFDIQTNDPNYNQIWQFPALAVDAYTPSFNLTEFSNLCRQENTKYILLYEYGNHEYFNSELTSQSILNLLNKTGSYSIEAAFGNEPNRVFVLKAT